MNQTYGVEALSDEQRREYWAALALRCTEGLSKHAVCSLLNHFGSAYAAISSIRSWPAAGVTGRAIEKHLRNTWREKALPEWRSAHGLDASIILWTDPRYPSRLRNIPDAPPLLYVAGDPALLDAPCVAVIGSRHCSRQSTDFAASVARDLSSAGITVVSGAAAGIDQAAQLASSHLEGRSAIVLASGIQAPLQNAELCRRVAAHGALISEFPPLFPASRATFPIRNRILSGISLGVAVVEAATEKSGSLITARSAAEQGRSVYVPSPASIRGSYPEGTKALLLDGATPITSAADIIADLLPQLKDGMRRLSQRISPSTTPVQDAPSVALTNPTAPLVQPPSEDTSASLPQKPEGRPATSTEAVIQTVSSATRDSSPTLALHNMCTSKYTPSNTKSSTDEDLVLSLLAKLPMAPDELLHAAMENSLSWTARRLSSLLMMMEVKGIVRRRNDSRYEAV